MAQSQPEGAPVAGLSAQRRAALGALVSRCPDELLAGIEQAAVGWPGPRTVFLIEAIAQEQCLRRQVNALFAPVVPLFRPRPDGLEALTFPAGLLMQLGRLAMAREAELLTLYETADEAGLKVIADRVCAAAAAIIREAPQRVWPDTAWPGAQTERANLPKLAECLELCALVRPSLDMLGDWLARPTPDQQASLQLLTRDAAATTQDGLARLLDILIAHVDDATWLPQLLANAFGNTASEQLIRESDAARFVDRLFAKVEHRVAEICQVSPGPDVDMAETLSSLRRTTQLLSQMGMVLPMDPDGEWQSSLRHARNRLGEWLGRQFSHADRAVMEALPMERVQLSGRMTRNAPRMDAEPDGAAAARALVFTELLGAAHSWSNALGSEAKRKQAETAILERITVWTDEALETLHRGTEDDPTRVLALIELAAGMLDRIEAHELARTIRRRANSAERSLAGLEPNALDLSVGAA